MGPGAIFLFTVLLNGVWAQEALFDRLPSCAVKCFEATLPLTTCAPNDLSCLCIDQPFQLAASGCNALNCTVVETMSATNETLAACGVPVKSQTADMIGVTASFGGLAVIMVAIRLIDRGISASARLGWDDLLIGLSGVASLFQNVPVIVAGALGFGRDIWSIPPDNLTNSLKWMYVTYFMYQITEALCQASILAFYLRIMTSKTSRYLTWILMGLVAGFGIGNTFAMSMQCWPIAFFWDGWRGEMEGKCTVDVRLFGFIRGAIEILLDITILSLPLPTLYKLQMSLRRKAQVMSMFCVGFVITAVSCLRLQALVAFDQSQNPTYDNTPGVYWCVTEANLFIVVACMPAMRPILQRLLPSCFGSIRDPSYGSNRAYGSSGPGKGGSYFGDSADHRGKNSVSLPFGGISKSIDVSVYRNERTAGSDRSESDVELVDRPGKGKGK